MCVCVFVCAGKSHGEQAQRDDGQRESIHPRTTDKLHGTYRHAHLQVRTKTTLTLIAIYWFVFEIGLTLVPTLQVLGRKYNFIYCSQA